MSFASALRRQRTQGSLCHNPHRLTLVFFGLATNALNVRNNNNLAFRYLPLLLLLMILQYGTALLYALYTAVVFFFLSFISLIADGPHHYHPACGHKGPSHLSPVHALQCFLSRCKFSTLTTRQPMVEFYLLTFPRFPLRKKEHKSYFGKNRPHDFRTSRCAAYLLDHSGDEHGFFKTDPIANSCPITTGRPRSSEVLRNPLTRWDVSSIPANGIFSLKKLKTKTKNAQRVEND